MNTIAGELNAASGYQAMERGIGATILKLGKPTEELISKFDESSRLADERLAVAESSLKEMMDLSGGGDFAMLMGIWKKSLSSIREARAQVKTNQIGSDEWIGLTSAAIQDQFRLRDLVFAPVNDQEQLLYYNTIIRSCAATLAEYAALERAGLFDAIENGSPVPDDILIKLDKFRTLADDSSARIMGVKSFSHTPDSLKNALELYEKEFLGAYGELRDDIYRKSRERNAKIAFLKGEVDSDKARIESHMKSRLDEVMNLAASTNVSKLGRSLLGAGGDVDLFQNVVENDFFALSQSSQEYMKISFVDTKGRELSRVDFDGVKFTRVKEKLRNISGDELMIEARKLGPGSVYISSVILNADSGKLEKPIRPIISIIAPVYANNALAGYIMAKIMASNFLSALKSGGTDENVYLLDKNGFYLKHPDEEKQWGFASGLGRQNNNILIEAPEIEEDLFSREAGIKVLKDGTAYIWTPVYYSNQRRDFWVMARSI
ncbi:MAG: cache domain-containing protein, partial [Nitrospinota bacterium]|nr:cache domain-containing protein [Nitrospinota bacterium]